MTELETLRQAGDRLLADILRDCRESRLATTFSGGFGDARPRVPDPGGRVTEWAERVIAAAHGELGAAECFAGVPECRRKSLETDAGYAVRCLKARLAALDELPSARRAPPALSG